MDSSFHQLGSGQPAPFEPVRIAFEPPRKAEPKAQAAPGPAAEAAAERRALQQAEQLSRLDPEKLVVEMDRAAGRFVQMLVDPLTEEVRWRYPSEAQLAYSRAVAAYLRAMLQA
jgi:hypothetical protein